MKHIKQRDHPVLHVGNQSESDSKLPRSFQECQLIVRAYSDDFGVELGEFLGLILELNQLPLAIASEMAPVENE